MGRLPAKTDFPVANVRRYLEPGPIVLLSTRDGEGANVMTLGWHLVMEFTPSLVGCVVSRANHTHRLLRERRACVINLPTAALVDTVVGIGNTSGAEVDKFERFGLTALPADRVDAPLIAQCHASFECRLHDDALAARYDFFVLEVVKAHVARRPARPETLHYTGDGVFVVAGRTVSRKSLFRPGMLGP